MDGPPSQPNDARNEDSGIADDSNNDRTFDEQLTFPDDHSTVVDGPPPPPNEDRREIVDAAALKKRCRTSR